jgi:lipopolysaccharide/colanic/teichoic acid biosynthesis glycosyltransferase
MRRFIDFIFASLAIALFSPAILLITLVLLVAQGPPIFFRHERMGKNHAKFKMLKFCTMTNQRDLAGNLLPDGSRVTRLGKFLRNTSLDEIPGFWNVLVGDMSLVGPRPLPPAYKKRYSKKQDRRHEVNPGVTGWAQINGRNAISWNEKFALDVWYVDNRSMWLDILILIKTVGYVRSRQGVLPLNNQAVEEFMGNKDEDKT